MVSANGGSHKIAEVLKMTNEEKLTFSEMRRMLQDLTRRLDEINFSKKVASDYITESFVHTVFLHISYLYFYGVTNYWCNQIYRFYEETTDLKKSEKGKRVDREFVYDLMKKTAVYKNFSGNEKYLQKFVKSLPMTENNAKFIYNHEPIDFAAYKEYVLDFTEFVFFSRDGFLTAADIHLFAIENGCVDTSR